MLIVNRCTQNKCAINSNETGSELTVVLPRSASASLICWKHASHSNNMNIKLAVKKRQNAYDVT